MSNGWAMVHVAACVLLLQLVCCSTPPSRAQARPDTRGKHRAKPGMVTMDNVEVDGGVGSSGKASNLVKNPSKVVVVLAPERAIELLKNPGIAASP